MLRYQYQNSAGGKERCCIWSVCRPAVSPSSGGYKHCSTSIVRFLSHTINIARRFRSVCVNISVRVGCVQWLSGDHTQQVLCIAWERVAKQRCGFQYSKYLHNLLPYSICLYIFSSPEHKVLRVSYCDRPLSVVRHRP